MMCLIVLGSACVHCVMASGRGETRLYLGDGSEHLEMNGVGRRWLVGFDLPASPDGEHMYFLRPYASAAHVLCFSHASVN